MQYQVPQFIEIEDKIFGPLTLKQFLYLAGGAGICLIFFTIFPLFLTIFLGIPVMAAALALAFYEVNGRPLVVAVEHGFYYLFGSTLYLWTPRQPKAPEAQTRATLTAPSPQMPVPKLSQSRLKDLAWSLNIKDRQQLGVTTEARSGFEI